VDRYKTEAANRSRRQAELSLLPAIALPSPPNPHLKYRSNPVEFAHDVLIIPFLSLDQIEILNAAAKPSKSSRVKLSTGHSVGKTFVLAILANWWFETRDPGVVITTAPTKRDVVDLLWTEIRLQRERAGLSDHFIGPRAPELFDHDEHWAKGYTAQKGESFQGRHRPSMMFLFDEAEGLDGSYWKTTNTMYKPSRDADHVWVVAENPTTTTSQSYQEESYVDEDGDPKWKRFNLSALDHPNVLAELAGQVPPIPNAVDLGQVRAWLADWFERIEPSEVDPDLDIEFPKGSGQWWRPDSEGEGRVLGRRPTGSTDSVWNERLFLRACAANLPLPHTGILPEMGCDVARKGRDRTEIHTRCGPCSLAHEDHGGWDTVRTSDRLMQLAGEWAKWQNSRLGSTARHIDPKTIRIKVDDTGVGGGVTDILRSNKYNVIAVNSGERATMIDKYVLIRDQLWFVVRDLAKVGKLDLSRLKPKTLARLKTQALAPTWQPTTNRRRRVDPKEFTTKTLKFSPDGMDALNLAYYEPPDRATTTLAGAQ
jgi:hypothetical protein